MKTAKDYLEDANKVVTRISTEDAIAAYNEGKGLFVDVRDSGSIAQTGTIKGALHVPRGMIEFAADNSHPLHVAALAKDADLYLVCGAGGQAALAGKTLQEMGFTSVTNIGGVPAWKEAGGPMQD